MEEEFNGEGDENLIDIRECGKVGLVLYLL